MLSSLSKACDQLTRTDITKETPECSKYSFPQALEVFIFSPAVRLKRNSTESIIKSQNKLFPGRLNTANQPCNFISPSNISAPKSVRRQVVESIGHIVEERNRCFESSFGYIGSILAGSPHNFAKS